MALRLIERVKWFVCVLSMFPLSLATETRISLGSRYNQEKSTPIWETISNAALDGFLFLGANVYASSDFGEARLRNAYQNANEVIPWNRLGIIQATWDDHDFGRNDGGMEFDGQPDSLRLF